jgi:8-oxo-dGTP pyrophosphatase MutT (NUDIX family)
MSTRSLVRPSDCSCAVPDEFAVAGSYTWQVNNSLKEPAMSFLRYVLMVAVDVPSGFTVGITKKKGPSFLLNRITFPGGKLEEGETPAVAASREMREETGLTIAEGAWIPLKVVRGKDYELTVLVAHCSTVFHARQWEEEPVWHLHCPSHLSYARQQPDQYAPDFIEVLTGALELLGSPALKAA